MTRIPTWKSIPALQFERARKLRKQSTKAEVLLWIQLSKEKLGVKFRRQHLIGNYILDFYAPTVRLAIEIDGVTHCTKAEREYDEIRAVQIQSFGIHILRFTNKDVYHNRVGVVQMIIDTIRDRTPP